MSKKKTLFNEFPPISDEEWMDKIRADLKGADFENKLVWQSKEVLKVMPYYREGNTKSLPHIGTLPGEFPYVRGGERLTNSWLVRQDIVVVDVIKANQKALDILKKGIDSIGFIFNKDTKFNLDFFRALMKSIFLESIEINLYPQGSAIELLQAFKELIAERGIKKDKIKGTLEADPISRYMIQGTLCIPIEDGIKYVKSVVNLADDMPNFKVLRVNGANFNNAGATTIQELAMTLSIGNEYLNVLSETGLKKETIAKKTSFTFGIGSNYFFEIAKLRAARMLWACIVKKHKVDDDKAMQMDVHAVTSEWNKTIYDPYVNLLRTQTEAMSASLGGADSLSVLPFNSIHNKADEFGERIARNQQLLLKEEAHFDKIVDPAAGSYYIENLTSLIAEQAWQLFIEIENKGGFLEALTKGFIQNIIKENAAKRDENIACGREKLLGTNIFPGKAEKDYKRLALSENENLELEIEPIRLYRAADHFEKLRYNTKKFGKIPKVFLLPIGNLVLRKARAQFSSNFFSVAGYEIIDNLGFSSADEGVSTALNNRADIVVICSSDEEYANVAPKIFLRLKGKAIVVIAGVPACEPELKNAGIEHFISIRSNILATLEGFNILLGISRK